MADVEIKYPIAIQWTVNRSEIMGGDSFRSKEFLALNGAKYSLSISPFGRKPENQGQTWIFLHFNDYSSGKFFNDDADILISIPSANWTKEYKSVCKKLHGWAFLCSTKDFFDASKKFFVNGNVVISITGNCKIREPVGKPNEIIKCKKQTLGTILWENDDDKDFKIVVKDQEINIHKNILAAYSAVFAAMFRSKMQETINNFVEIPNYQFEVIEIIVKLCYDINIPGDHLFEHKIELFEFVDQYQMDNLKNDIEKFLIKKVSVANVCSLANCAIIGKAANLKSRCYNLLMKCLKSGTPVADLESLNKDFKLEIFDNAFISVL